MSESQPVNSETNLQLLILDLYEQFGRMPTEDEVYDFIFGGNDLRMMIWNQAKEQDERSSETGTP